MAKCVTCGKSEIASNGWTWQPFGPDDKIASFTTPGYHYRGFPALHVCDACKGIIETADAIRFHYKGQGYLAEQGQVKEV